MEHGFFHPDLGYWQAIGGEPEELLLTYPEGTSQIPVKPSADHQWKGGKWVYVQPPEPTPEEIRASLPALTARQFRLGLIGGGFSLTDVENALAAISDPVERQKGQVEWQYATQFNRLHPLVVQLSETLGLTPEQVDDLWATALNL